MSEKEGRGKSRCVLGARPLCGARPDPAINCEQLCFETGRRLLIEREGFLHK